MGQKAKYSLRAHIVRFAPESGLKSDIAGGPFRANFGSRRASFYHLVGAGEQVRRNREVERLFINRRAQLAALAARYACAPSRRLRRQRDGSPTAEGCCDKANKFREWARLWQKAAIGFGLVAAVLSIVGFGLAIKSIEQRTVTSTRYHELAEIAQSLCRLRNGGTQVIRVEKIEVSNTAQAIVGNPNPSAT
jgi:hypothetical protein